MPYLFLESFNGKRRMTKVKGTQGASCHGKIVAEVLGGPVLLDPCTGEGAIVAYFPPAEGYPEYIEHATVHLCVDCAGDLFKFPAPLKVLDTMIGLVDTWHEEFEGLVPAYNSLETIRLNGDFCEVEGCLHGGWLIENDTVFCLEHSVDIVYQCMNAFALMKGSAKTNILREWIERDVIVQRVVEDTYDHHLPREGGLEAAVEDVVESLMGDPGWMAWASSSYAAKRQEWYDAGSPVEQQEVKRDLGVTAEMRLNDFMDEVVG